MLIRKSSVSTYGASEAVQRSANASILGLSTQPGKWTLFKPDIIFLISAEVLPSPQITNCQLLDLLKAIFAASKTGWKSKFANDYRHSINVASYRPICPDHPHHSLRFAHCDSDTWPNGVVSGNTLSLLQTITSGKCQCPIRKPLAIADMPVAFLHRSFCQPKYGQRITNPKGLRNCGQGIQEN